MEKSLDYKGRWRNHTVAFRVSDEEAKLLNEMWVHSPPLGAQGNFKRKEKHDTM